MNEHNYASLEASQRLVEAEIVLETEAIWEYDDPCSDPADPAWDQYGEWRLVYKPYKIGQMHNRQIPASSMAEVWRELPKGITKESYLRIGKSRTLTWIEIPFSEGEPFASINPTDALIGLLIWVTEQRKEKL